MMPKADLVFVTYCLGSGGAEKQLLWIARTLARSGRTCSIAELVRKPGNSRLDDLIRAARKDGVGFSFAESRPSYLQAWWRIRRLVRGRKSALVWSWGLRADLVTFFVRQEHRHLRWISSLRSASREQLRTQAPYLRLVSRSVYRYIANTHLNCELLEEYVPGTKSRCRVFYNVVEELELPPVSLPADRPNPLRVVMLGNVVQPTKGYDVAIELGARIAREDLPVEIHIAGRPDPAGWFMQEIARRGVGSVIHYHGETGAPHEFLRSGHVYLLLSRAEGMPNSLLEAASMGLPCIATKVGDLPAMVTDGDQMRLIDIGSAEAAYAAIAGARDNWAETVAMGSRGLDWCRTRFGAPHGEAQLHEIVREIAEPA